VFGGSGVRRQLLSMLCMRQQGFQLITLGTQRGKLRL
jgi:hypothetical protein